MDQTLAARLLTGEVSEHAFAEHPDQIRPVDPDVGNLAFTFAKPAPVCQQLDQPEITPRREFLFNRHPRRGALLFPPFRLLAPDRLHRAFEQAGFCRLLAPPDDANIRLPVLLAHAGRRFLEEGPGLLRGAGLGNGLIGGEHPVHDAAQLAGQASVKGCEALVNARILAIARLEHVVREARTPAETAR